jgi:hypothetical protein
MLVPLIDTVAPQGKNAELVLDKSIADNPAVYIMALL